MINEFRPMNHLTSLQNLICTIGNLPTSYALSLSYEEQIWWLCDFLEKKVFPAIEENTNISEETQQAFLELQQYVTDYFNNLDVQEEINHKLNEMYENGTLTNLIKQYIDPQFSVQNTRISNVERIVNNAISGMPVPVSSTDEMTDTSKIYVNTSNGKWYYYNSGSWLIGGIYQSQGINDNSILPSKTTYLSPVKNLWNGEYLHGYVMQSSNSNEYYIKKADGGTIAIIKVLPETTYTVSKSNNTNRFRIAFYNNYPPFINSDNPSENEKAISGITSDDATKLTVTTPTNTNYMAVYLSTSSENTNPVNFQVELGSEQTPFNYDYYFEKLKLTNENFPNDFIDTNKIKNGAVNQEKVSFLKREKNLWNGEYIHGYVLSGDESEPTGYRLEKRTGGTIAIVKIEQNTTYTISKSLDTDRFRIGFFSEYPIKIDGSPTSAISGKSLDLQTSCTITSPSNANYLVVYLSSVQENLEPSDFQVELGSTKTPFSYSYLFPLLKINNDNIDDNSIDNSKIRYGFRTPYVCLDMRNIYLSDTVEGFIPSENRSINDIYSLYDNLLTNYSDIMTKELLGYDGDNNPVYIYKIRNNKENKQTVANKIITITSIHSFEVINVYSTYLLIKDLLEKWQTKDELKSPRFNFDYDIIPLVNPYGYVHKSRVNINGVDINRNFPAGWYDIAEGEGTEYYKGTSPLSEIETQNISNYLLNNKDNIAWVIDIHASAPNDHWLGSRKSNLDRYFNGISNLMKCVITEYFPESPTKTINVKPSGLATFTTYVNSLNLDGNILECGAVGNENLNYRTRFFKTFIGNTLISIVNSFNN